ncbi:hypothetical protein [Azospirillum endophyticum]
MFPYLKGMQSLVENTVRFPSKNHAQPPTPSINPTAGTD